MPAHHVPRDIDLLYRAPGADEFSELASGEWWSARGSWIEVGDHRYWNVRRTLKWFAACFIAIEGLFGLPLLLIALELLGRAGSEPAVRAIVTGLVVAMVVGSGLFWVTLHGVIARRLARIHLRAAAGVVATVRFRPDLALERRVSIGHSDDTGLLCIEPDALVFHGERIDARVARADVAQVRIGARTVHSAFLGCEVVLALAVPFAGSTRISIVSHDALTPLGGIASSHRLRSQLAAWLDG